MAFFDAVMTCLSKYVTFSGRASRPEFWKFALFVLLLMVVAGIMNVLVFGPVISSSVTEWTSHVTSEQAITSSTEVTYGPGPFQDIALWLIALPLLTAAWRRLHDGGNPGWLVLLPIAAVGIMTAAIQFGPTKIVEFPVMDATTGTRIPLSVTFPAPPIWLRIVGVLSILIGSVLALIGLCMKSESSDNKYGPNPSEASK